MAYWSVCIQCAQTGLHNDGAGVCIVCEEGNKARIQPTDPTPAARRWRKTMLEHKVESKININEHGLVTLVGWIIVDKAGKVYCHSSDDEYNGTPYVTRTKKSSERKRINACIRGKSMRVCVAIAWGEGKEFEL